MHLEVNKIVPRSRTFHTVLTGESDFGFMLFNRDLTSSEISYVTIENINFELVYAVFVFPVLEYAACPGEIPVSADPSSAASCGIS
jgi:hypothetical protein